MKTLIALALSAALLAACLPLAGCTGHVNPDGTAVSKTEDALIVANDAYTFGITEVDAAVRSGLLRPIDVTPYLPYRNAARAALDQASRDLAAGNTAAAQVSLDSATAALAKLQPLLQRAKGK